MQVKLFGVSITTSAEVSLAEVFTDLEKHNGENIDYYGSDRRIYVAERDGYHVLLALTIRDQKRWMQMTEEKDGTVIVEPQEIAENRHMVDFNYLAIDQNSGRGLYLFYPGSLSILSLNRIMAKNHSDLLIAKRTAWLEAVGRTRQNLKLAKDQFENNWSLSPIIQPKDLPEFLDELSTISSLQLEFTSVIDEASLFGGLDKYVELARYKVNFSEKLDANKVAKKILREVERTKPRGGYVVGRETDGSRISYEIGGQPTTVFDRLEYDQVASVAIKPKSFEKSKQLDRMIGTMKTNKSMFHRRADN